MNHLDFVIHVARPIDRLSLAAQTAIAPHLAAAAEDHAVALDPAVILALILPDTGATWAELDIPMRYSPGEQARALADMFVDTGHLTTDEHGVAYTPDGRSAAHAVAELMSTALDELWEPDRHQLAQLEQLVAPVVTAARDTATPFVEHTATMIAPEQPSDAYQLWRHLVTIRRHRSDAHMAAWTAAGHDHHTIRTLRPGPERDAIETDTNSRHATIWEPLTPEQRTRLLAGLACLNGIGTPH